MNLKPPAKTSDPRQFATLIMDCDFGLDIKRHDSEAAARAYAEEQFDGIACEGEPDGNEYEPDEERNTTILVVQILAIETV